MQNNFRRIVAIIVAALMLLIFVAKQFHWNNPSHHGYEPNISNHQNARPENIATPADNAENRNQGNIPAKVYDVLKYIQQNHEAMEGYVGRRVFTNYEKVVPTTDQNGNRIRYQEWDVNPKIHGQNRGTERILTGSDGRAWYTNDHYQTFTEIK